MGHQVMLLALSLLAVKSQAWMAQSPACSIGTCQCTTSSNSLYPDVVCFVSSITPSDATVTALPNDIQSLILNCGSSKSLSFLSDSIFEKFLQLRSLRIEQCNINLLTAQSFRGLASLENLSMSETILPLMNTNTFLHLPDLQFLSIIFCNITSLPDIFYLKSLQYLNVSHNNLHSIELETSANTDNIPQTGYLHNLTTIDLSYNNISSTPLELIRRTPRVQMLYLVGLPLTELYIPENTQLKNLIILDAKESSLVVVDIPGLNMAKDIKGLRLEGTGRPLHIPGLSHLTSLEELSLNNFAITDTIWQQLNSSLLVGLILASNNLTTIDVSYLPALLLLDVAKNNISYLNASTFYNQINLTNVNVSHNSIQELPVETFQETVTLQIVDVSYNLITRLQTGVFRGLKQLFYLDLSNNVISSLPYSIFKDLSSIRSLSIRGNNLQFLPKLNYMQELIILDISHNQLTLLLASDLSGLGNLGTLFVNDNRLTILPPNLLSGCPNVRHAWFNNNQISNIGTFGAHPKLYSLRLDNNRIADFISESPLVHLQKLEYLFLDTNNLTTLNYNIFPHSLHAISLDNNYLVNLYSTSFSYMPNLSYVSLANNQRLLYIPQHVVSVFKNLSPKPTFNIEGNIFYCDCEMSYLKVISEDKYSNLVFQNYYPRFEGLDNSKCYTPFEGGTYRYFKDVPLSHFACTYSETWCIPLCSCCADSSNCECTLSCPSECECYYGGSVFKKFYIHIMCRSKNLEQVPDGMPYKTVMLYLDGNQFNHLSKQNFDRLQHAEEIYLNSSYIKSMDNGTFENVSVLISLFLNDNKLTSIDDNFFGRLTTVKQIYLHNNFIDVISSDAFSQLSSIETVTLHNNRLMFLKDVLKIPHPMALTLSGNPWSCNCEVSKVIMRTFYEIKEAITDIKKLCCSFYENSLLNDLDSRGNTLSPTHINEGFTISNPSKLVGNTSRLFSSEDYTPIPSDRRSSCFPLLGFNYEDYCTPTASNSTFFKSTSSSDFPPGFTTLIVITITLLLIAAGVVFVMVKRQEFQAWVFVKLGVRILDKKVHMDKEDAAQKVFDAFISYSSKDEEFVASRLVPLLENGERKYRLCVHYRDFPVGRNITDTIYRAIQNSSRTILMLSVNFLSSEWCRFEFQTAHHHILREGSHRLIVVMLGDVPEEMLDPDLKVHIKSKTYLKYGDRWFWEKLFFAMPSIKDRQINTDDEQRADILQRMEVLARDELVDQQANNPGQLFNGQDITDERLHIDDHIQQQGGNDGPQDSLLVNDKSQLSPNVNFGFFNVDDNVAEDLDNSADDKV